MHKYGTVDEQLLRISNYPDAGGEIVAKGKAGPKVHENDGAHANEKVKARKRGRASARKSANENWRTREHGKKTSVKAKVCLFLSYAIATTFQLYHGSDMMYEMRTRKPKPMLLPTHIDRHGMRRTGLC